MVLHHIIRASSFKNESNSGLYRKDDSCIPSHGLCYLTTGVSSSMYYGFWLFQGRWWSCWSKEVPWGILQTKMCEATTRISGKIECCDFIWMCNMFWRSALFFKIVLTDTSSFFFFGSQACVKRIQGDDSGHKHCTGQYFDYWHCVDKCVSSWSMLFLFTSSRTIWYWDEIGFWIFRLHQSCLQN